MVVKKYTICYNLAFQTLCQCSSSLVFWIVSTCMEWI